MKNKFSKKIILGTAQFGSKYGISNNTGVVDQIEIKKVIDYANKNNINSIDVAPSYGQAENKLGKLKKLKNFKIYNKISKINLNKKNTNYLIENEIKNSLKLLNVNQFEGIFLHNPEDLLSKKGESIYDFLIKQKNNKLIKKIGISVYTIKETQKLLDYYDFDIIQIPVNIFFQDFIESDFLKFLKSKQLKIFARSIFLQGLLLMDKRPKKFNRFTKHFNKYDNFLEFNHISRLQACIEFIKTIKEIDYYIFGFESLNQFKKILHFFLTQEKKYEWKDFQVKNSKLTNPINWKSF